jgi:tetratricopeptide (TPR) repeat protein
MVPFAAEIEDIRFALDEALSRSDIVHGAELLAAIRSTWEGLGIEAEGMARNQAYLAALPPTQTRLLALLFTNVALSLGNSGKMALAFETATQALEHARACGEPHVLAKALLIRTRTAIDLGRLDDAAADHSEVQAITSIPLLVNLDMLANRAALAAARGDLEAAAKTYEDLHRRFRSMGDTSNEGSTANYLAENFHARGHTERAIAIVREYLPKTRSGNDRSLFLMMMTNLAGYSAAVDDLTSAFGAAREVVATLAARDLDHAFLDASMEHLALAMALRGDLSRAATLEGYANAAIERNGLGRGFTETTTYDRLSARLRESLAPEELARLTTEGAALTPEAAVALALEDI